MRAIRSTPTGVEFQGNADAPDPRPGEALVRVLRVEIDRDERAILPDEGIPGRRFVGVVERGDDRCPRGTRVVADPHLRCGQCDLCRGGLGDHCRNRQTLGADGRDGCLAEYVVVPIENLVPVPDAVDDEAAVFAWTLAGSIHVAHMLRVDAKSFVTVLGDNARGLLCAQWLVSLNASVRLLGSDAERFGICEKWGVRHRHVDDVGRRADQDVVIDCTSSAAGLVLAMRLVRPRGSVVVRGRAAPGVDLTPLTEGELTLIGSRAGSLADAVRALNDGRVDVLSLISRRIRLEDVPDTLDSPAGPSEFQTLVEV